MTEIHTHRYYEEDMVIHTAQGDLLEDKKQQVDNPLEETQNSEETQNLEKALEQE